MLKHKEAFPLERAFLPFHIRQFHHQPTNQPIHLPPVGPSPPISIPCSPFAAPSPLLLYNILSANFMTQFPPLNSINFFLLHSLTHSPSDPRVISYSTPTTTNQSVSVVTSSFIPPVTDRPTDRPPPSPSTVKRCRRRLKAAAKQSSLSKERRGDNWMVVHQNDAKSVRPAGRGGGQYLRCGHFH